jgi:hypothetical protein
VAPADEEALLDEARATEELRALVPALGSIPLNLSGLIVPVFSGLAAVVTVRFMGAQTVSLEHARAALFAHPDLAPADAVDLGAEDDEGNDEGDDSRSQARTAPRPEGAADDGDKDVGGAASLRDAVDSDAVRVQTPRVTPDGSLRLVVMADPLHRTAAACESIIAGWLAEARD